ncbi:uncharacterized protein N7469_001925 [Penicillium citrinum]|uniref:Uncharacterized protein n=1 Tax=Penicillium citrinum TaxID=5077 RepID=A0A9W9P9A2_PENCI|nr:uncharacterized protein N7469_001925 [Penicillium citrinum]KAJ5240334.1 hypothetical protein N7469_001925 [Penicillium citrinum]
MSQFVSSGKNFITFTVWPISFGKARPRRVKSRVVSLAKLAIFLLHEPRASSVVTDARAQRGILLAAIQNAKPVHAAAAP